MSIQHYLVKQNSDDWFSLRLERFTASTYNKLFQGKSTQGYKDTIYSVAAEIVTGESDELELNTYWTERGHLLESEARREYAELYFRNVTEGGFFAYNERLGSSPDACVDDDGLLEIKCFAAKRCMQIIDSEVIPKDVLNQIQFQLFTSGKKWCDFVLYHPKLPLFVKRVERNEAEMDKVRIKMEGHIKEVEQIVKKIRNYGK